MKSRVKEPEASQTRIPAARVEIRLLGRYWILSSLRSALDVALSFGFLCADQKLRLGTVATRTSVHPSVQLHRFGNCSSLDTMKLSAIIAIVAASVALASPAAVSLERSVKEVRNADGSIVTVSCVECPCTDGWEGKCKCIPNGCCC
ncbi:hypothetical protein BDW02DRAFT_573602 [Decorospora gaudefroyi]|uniref:Uncharacterized protein n=1 Tax=Decorospora gaudefroyi TaxID=184978 RepID=A0A6A5JY30_9PLEO|nr:hypothetical protein BDW02DRAFT_573602 [Decorospora gaudefroyi]